MSDDFGMLGVTVEPSGETEQAFEIWQDNMDSATLFFSLSTQWRKVAAGKRFLHTGLDYAAAAALIGLEFGRKAKKARRVMRDLMIMESAALPVLNEDGA